jgi:hypothetical protein
MRASAAICLSLIVAACATDKPETKPAATDTTGTAACDDATARRLAEDLGTRMKNVSLLAPPADVEKAMREQYAGLVTEDLFDRWIATPATAPGREVSSPWPDRIAVDSVQADKECKVYGTVVYRTSGGDTDTRVPVAITMTPGSDARIQAVQMGDAGPASPDTGVQNEPTAEDAVATVRRYYEAIDAKRYRDAYALWSDDGRSSGQTYEAFAKGFAETATVSVETGKPGDVGAAAGSRYIEIPVTITARTTGGSTQHFGGVYKLRRAVVDGATAAQRAWRIYDAEIVQH